MLDKWIPEVRHFCGSCPVILVACIAASLVVAEVKPDVLITNFGRFSTYIGRIFYLDSGQLVFSDIYGTKDSWYWGLGKWAKLIGETLIIAYLGTAIGAIGAFLMCFLAASNLVTNRITLFAARRFLEFCRTVPELVFALTFVVAFGLGPLPGVLAIAIHTLGALGKQFAEVVENIDMKPFEGVMSTGGTWTEAVRFSAGASEGRLRGMQILLVILSLFFIALPLVLLVWSGDARLLAGAMFGAIVVAGGYAWMQKNRPRDYDPRRVPEDMLP